MVCRKEKKTMQTVAEKRSEAYRRYAEAYKPFAALVAIIAAQPSERRDMKSGLEAQEPYLKGLDVSDEGALSAAYRTAVEGFLTATRAAANERLQLYVMANKVKPPN